MRQHLRWILQPFLGKRATIRVLLAVALLGSIAGGCGPYLRSVDPEPYHVLAGREPRELFLFDVTHRFLWMASLEGYLSEVKPTQQNLKAAMRQGMRVTPVLEDGPPEQATLLWAVLRLRQGLVEKSDLTWVLSTRPLVLPWSDMPGHDGHRDRPSATL